MTEMKTPVRLCRAVLIAAVLSSTLAIAQTQSSDAPLALTGSIPMPHVQGRIDHFALGNEGTMFISALGNNTEEVIDLAGGVVGHTIPGIPKPQGVAYAPEVKKIFVGSDEGKLYIFNAERYAQLATIDFGDDVDNLRYDPSAKRLYVGYGDGAIAMVDVTANQRLPKEFKLGAHPESFQLEKSGPNIYVNLPGLKQIAAINRQTGAITRWPIKQESNFPMALDEADHRLFVVTREPPRLLVVDTNSGGVVATLPCVQDSDDLYYDAARKRIYAAGGEGYISVFQQQDADHYRLLAKIPSQLGARTAGYFGKLGKGFDRLYVAVPARAEHGAEVLIYTIQD
jgi:DNA-binding beta-propeller fold protein YncE